MNNCSKMIGKKSKFSQDMCDKFDKPAREIIKTILGEYIEDNPDIYGEDMIINIPECRYKYLELQVCINWISETFPYEKPYIYARKQKFADGTLFLVLNKNMTKGLLFNKKSISEDARRVKKYSREFVYEIPWNRILPVYMSNFDKDVILMYS
jgi:hypothetical protein